jgi:hypothetical protein
MKYASSGGVTASNEGASTSGAASQTASSVLSGSGVLNLRPGSTTSSGPLAQMFSSMSADVAHEYLEKAADLLLEFAQADTVVKSLMSTQSLLTRLFQMFNKIEPPILLKVYPNAFVMIISPISCSADWSLCVFCFCYVTIYSFCADS